MLLLKLFLVPLLVAGVTLAARRWGPRVGGWLSALPTVAGPTLCFYAIEQGNRFAARASHAALVGLVAVPLFCVAFVYSSRRAGWAPGLLLGWSLFFAGVFVLERVSPGLALGMVLLAASCAAAYLALPVHQPLTEGPIASRWDLPTRMVAAAILILALTASADVLGPAIAGYLTPFPVGIAVIAAFTQSQRGSDSVVVYFRGYLPSLVSFGLFCAVLAVALEPLGFPLALALAIAGQLAMQTLTVWTLERIAAR